MEAPIDRSHISTEGRLDASREFDSLSVTDAVRLMIEDHRAVVDAVFNASPALVSFLESLIPRMKQGGRVIYLGAGTSGRLGVLDAAECPPTFQSRPEQVVGIIAGGDASLRKSSEGLEDDPDGARAELHALNLGALDTVLGIAAGGTTPYVTGGLALARRNGAATALLTCADSSAALPVECDCVIRLHTGAEVLAGSTRLKAGSATKLALNIITTVAFTKLGKVYSNLMVDLRATNQKLLDRAIRIVLELCPDLDRTRAGLLIDRAEGRVKAAILMHRLDLDSRAANEMIEAHDGNLRSALRAVPASTDHT